MNGLEKQLRKKINQSIEKLAACKQKITVGKRTFVQTPFSHCTLKLE